MKRASRDISKVLLAAEAAYLADVRCTDISCEHDTQACGEYDAITYRAVWPILTSVEDS